MNAGESNRATVRESKHDRKQKNAAVRTNEHRRPLLRDSEEGYKPKKKIPGNEQRPHRNKTSGGEKARRDICRHKARKKYRPRSLFMTRPDIIALVVNTWRESSLGECISARMHA